jgi:aspartyl-tRNA(Asn)/glutamyl-tRNA(Gln) amidotransferase subunit A
MANHTHSRRAFLAAAASAATLWNCRSELTSVSGDLTSLTLGQASAALRARVVSSVELTQACLDRIDRYNPLLNAFITVDAEGALETARSIDADLMQGQRPGPLQGIPIALKDNIDTAGIRSTGASEVFENRVPEEDAEVARRLKGAGAVLLGKLNLHEFAYGGSSTTTHFGTMHNPWNLDHITGGSSGGPAAAVSSDLCFAALGTDTAGSVRGPAAHCGIAGLKPTYGRVSTRGVMTLSWTLDHVGPLGKTVEDVALMLNVIAGHDRLEPTTVAVPVPDYARALGQPTGRLRIGVPQSPFWENLDPEVEQAAGIALELMSDLTSGPAREIELPPSGSPATIWGAEAYAYHTPWITTTPELYQPGTRRSLEGAADAPSGEYAEALREVNLLRQQIRAVFEDVDVLILPTMKEPAGRLDGDQGPGRGNNNVAFDVFGLPSISVPCGFTESGLPIGVQIVGAHWAESTVLALAYAYEQSTTWHTIGPPMESYL